MSSMRRVVPVVVAVSVLAVVAVTAGVASPQLAPKKFWLPTYVAQEFGGKNLGSWFTPDEVVRADVLRCRGTSPSYVGRDRFLGGKSRLFYAWRCRAMSEAFYISSGRRWCVGHPSFTLMVVPAVRPKFRVVDLSITNTSEEC